MQGIFCITQIFDFAQICARPAANNYVSQRKAYYVQPLQSARAASSSGAKRRVRRPPDAGESLPKTVSANRSVDSRVWCGSTASFAQLGREFEEVVTIDVKCEDISFGSGMAGNVVAAIIAKCGMNRLGPECCRYSRVPSTTAHDPEKWPAFGKFAGKQRTTALSSDRGYHQLPRLNHECRTVTVPRGGAVRLARSRRSRPSPCQRECAQRRRRSCFSRESKHRVATRKNNCKVELDGCIECGIYRAVG